MSGGRVSRTRLSRRSPGDGKQQDGTSACARADDAFGQASVPSPGDQLGAS